MSEERPVYSIQQTYIIKPISKSEKRILTCDERIDIPTIEPLPSVQPFGYYFKYLTVIPCIELAGEFLSEFNLTLETNEGVTVLPVMINPGDRDPFENPYMNFRYVLFLPRGATGVKSCKLIQKATGKEVQHNFTFGVMSPPYNYDNSLFGYSLSSLNSYVRGITDKLNQLKLTSETTSFVKEKLPKGEGIQTIEFKKDRLYFTTVFSYPTSSEATVHHPVITVENDSGLQDYRLSLNKESQTVIVDLLAGMITVYDTNTGEIMQQFKLPVTLNGVNMISFREFDDIKDSTLDVEIKGRSVR